MAKKKQVKRSQTKVERLAAQAQEAERARLWPPEVFHWITDDRLPAKVKMAEG